MSWLAPLGFLGFIGLVMLVVIYIIKPNYQQKLISSTYIWKLSLKYKKRRLPINKLNNVLLFLCQCLILTICALLLAQPVIPAEHLGDENEKIIIIDASAGMLVGSGGDNRFERAVSETKGLVDSTLSEGGVVSVVLADAEPDFVVQRASEAQKDEIHAKLDLLLEGKSQCTYGSADMQGAVTLAEEVLRYNSEAQVYLYTATNYLEKNNIIVQNVAKEGEWNAAILDCSARLNDNNHCEISVDVGCFGRSEQLTVSCQVYGANGRSQKVDPVSKVEFFDPTAETRTVVFGTDDFGSPLTSFDYLEVYVSVDDSFYDDNVFFLYGGTKQTIRVQYASSLPNNYFAGMFRSMRETMKNTWNIDFVELKGDEKPATEGYDLYIFEHKMPDVMPEDGVVMLIDPKTAPDGSGLRLGEMVLSNNNGDPDERLADGVDHELMNYVDVSRISVARYRKILYHDGYEELAFYNGEPVILMRNDSATKVLVWAFDLNYSNLGVTPDFTFMMYNMFNYFIPATLSTNSFEIGDTVSFNGRGTELKVTGTETDLSFENAKAEMTVSKPGTYTVTQKPMKGDHLIIENFFVRIPEDESCITKEVDALPEFNVDRVLEQTHQDLLFYFAIALVSFMFIEWFLQSRKNY
ncbi:MAG: BatA domain-containing protein [Clostridia bacterium]|nr:BatA domain-containing protein [Clostridia bacterium]